MTKVGGLTLRESLESTNLCCYIICLVFHRVGIPTGMYSIRISIYLFKILINPMIKLFFHSIMPVQTSSASGNKQENLLFFGRLPASAVREAEMWKFFNFLTVLSADCGRSFNQAVLSKFSGNSPVIFKLIKNNEILHWKYFKFFKKII